MLFSPLDDMVVIVIKPHIIEQLLLVHYVDVMLGLQVRGLSLDHLLVLMADLLCNVTRAIHASLFTGMEYPRRIFNYLTSMLR